MKFLADRVEKLLKTNDCVVIEGFGGFIKNISPARIVDSYIYPPQTEISFNAMLRHDDGLLYSMVADEQQISYKTAIAEVSKHIRRLKQEISDSQTVDFGSIGLFCYEKDTIQFTPKEADYLPENFGLNKIKCFERIEQRLPTKAIEVEGKKLVIDLHSLSRQAMRYAASIAILLSVALFMPNASTKSQYAGVLVYPTVNESIEKPTARDIESEERLQKCALFQSSTRKVGEPVIEVEHSVEEIKKFHVVVASFLREAQAEEFCSQQAGATILKSKGNTPQYRCVVGSFATEEQAIDKKHEIKDSQDISSWVLYQK